MQRQSVEMTHENSIPVPLMLDAYSKELANIPHLSEKMIVDLVNGHEVVDDLLQEKRLQGGLSRFMGCLDGSNRRRDDIIHQQTQRSLEVLTSWALDLTDCVRFTQENLILVAQKLQKTRSDLLDVARAVCVNDQQIKIIENALEALDFRISRRLIEAEKRLLTIEDKYEIIELTEAWKSGRYYVGYPLPLQIAFVIDDLMRGERGCRILENTRTKGFLLDRIINYAREVCPQLVGKVMSLTDHWIPYADFDNETKRSVAAYGVLGEKDSYLHNVLSEYLASKDFPVWYVEIQEAGELPELIDISDYAEILLLEARKNWGVNVSG